MKKSILLIALLLGIVSGAKADDGITIATYGNATGNTTRTMTLAVTHDTNNYVAFQLDLTLPTGTSIDATNITAKAPMKAGGTVTIGSDSYTTNFVLDAAQISSDTDAGTVTYRVIGYNMGNVALEGTSGDICLTVPYNTSTEGGITYAAETFTVSNVIFVENDTNLTGVSLAATTDYRLWGDVVKDGTIDGKDYQAVANMVAGVANTGTIDKFAADSDQNDTVNGIDYQAISNTIAGK